MPILAYHMNQNSPAGSLVATFEVNWKGRDKDFILVEETRSRLHQVIQAKGFVSSITRNDN